LSIDVKVTYDRLRAAKVGDVVTYQELSALIGRDIRKTAAWVLSSARRKVLHDDSIVFGVIYKVGVKRLNDQEIVATGHDAITMIHRRAVRSIKKITAVQDFHALSPADQIRHNTYASVLGMLSHTTRDKQIKRIEAVVEKSQAELAVQRTLKALVE
jgi:hypothetical protein